MLARGGRPTNLEVDFNHLVKSLTLGRLAESRCVHSECHPGQRWAIFRINLSYNSQKRTKIKGIKKYKGVCSTRAAARDHGGARSDGS